MTHYSKRSRVAVGITLAAVVVLLMLFASELAFRYRWASETLDEIAPRYARLAGLKAAGDEIRATVGEVDAALAASAYPETMDHGKVGSELQQRIRKLAEANAVSVLNSQVLALRSQKEFAEIPLSIALEGSVGGIREFLAGLASQKPSVQVDEVTLQPVRTRSPQDAAAQKIMVNIVVSAVTLAGNAK